MSVRSKRSKTKILAIMISIIMMFCNIACFSSASSEDSPDTNRIPIDDYILVCMEHEYSFPEKDYEPSYFGEEYVERVEPILVYNEGRTANKDDFSRCEILYLTEFGKDHIDSFIELLNARPDILAAERDYNVLNAFEEGIENNRLMGDANHDGRVDAVDGRLVLRRAAKLETDIALNEALCDVDYDNDITANDAQLILKIAAGLIDPIR
ncbi:MAG: dockerin type I repeat-containing protein [Clostridia bacterium]|nr:dockerin type I repeat-containing protein [Clostridia bacterium]